MKRCTRCKKHKKLQAFNKNRARPDGLGLYCRVCANAATRASYAKTHVRKSWGFPGYARAHVRVQEARGKANAYTCSCGEPATDWSLCHEEITQSWRVDIHTKSFIGRIYSLAVEDYVAKCHACNMRDGSPKDAQLGDMLYRMGKVSRPDLL